MSNIFNSSVNRLVLFAIDFAVSGLSPVSTQNLIPDFLMKLIVSGTWSYSISSIADAPMI